MADSNGKPNRPFYLEIDLPGGVQRVNLSRFQAEGKLTPPKPAGRFPCSCQKGYARQEGGLCGDCTEMVREADRFARWLAGEGDDDDYPM